MTTTPVNEVQTAIAANMSETQLLALVRDAAKTCGWLCYHTHRSDRSEAGFPDICMVRGVRIIFAELKSAKGKLSGEQMQWMSNLTVARGTTVQVFIWRPNDWLSGAITKVLSS